MSNEPTEKVLSFDDIINATDRNTEKVYVPEWDGYIFISAWTGKQRSQFEEACLKIQDQKNGQLRGIELFYARLLLWGCTNEDGSPMFTEDQAKKIVAVRSSKVINDIVEKIQKINGVSKQDVDDLAGN